MSLNATEKIKQIWERPPGKKQALKAGLYLVATPIGNLGDMTLRALDVLADADIVVCEDTRVTGKLLAHFGLKKMLLRYNDHSTEKDRKVIVEKIHAGQIVALVSDAGMPLISDPGYKLIRDCVERNFYITSLPGANAPLMAVQLSGLPSECFSFLGFLPPKSAARQKVLAGWRGVPGSLVVFETAPRLASMLSDVQTVLGERDIAVTRELTKLYEEIRRGTISDLIEALEPEEGAGIKGEIVVVIGPGAAASFSDQDIENQLKQALKTMSTKESATHVASLSGRPRKEIYDLALKMKGGNE